MAKLTATVNGDFDRFCRYLEKVLLNSSWSASLEDIHNAALGAVRCRIMVFERYSYFGGNRVSLNITLLSSGGPIQVIAITAGGSQAVLWKVNTVGEETFLEKLQEAINAYK